MTDKLFDDCVELASKRLQAFKDDEFLDKDPKWLGAWHSYSLRFSETRPRYVMIPKDNIQPIVDEALKSRHVFDLLKFIVSTRLRSGADCPQPIAEMVAKFLDGEFAHKQSGQSRKKRAWARDYAVIEAIRFLKESQSSEHYECRIPVVRNDEYKAKNKSAAFTFTEVIEKAVRIAWDKKLTQKQIVNIWKNGKRRKRVKDLYAAYLLSLLDEVNDVEWV